MRAEAFPVSCFIQTPFRHFARNRPFLPSCRNQASSRTNFVVACAKRPGRAAEHPRVELVNITELRARAASEWGIDFDPHEKHADEVEILTRATSSDESDCEAIPLLVRHRNFLSIEQCESLINKQSKKTNSTDEADLYLNFRVNQEVSHSDGQQSNEAAALIAATEISATSSLDAGSRSGFRAQVDPQLPEVEAVLDKLGELLGFKAKQRKWVFEEGAWVRPNKRQVVVRDVTTVHYEHGEGVAPHVDGKDLTILICLHQPQFGGDTVFTTQGIAVPPLQGQAILYSSKTAMPHFAQPVEKGVKWVMQLLIDHGVRADELEVDYITGQVTRNV